MLLPILITGPDPLPLSYERDSWEQRLLNYVHTPYAHFPYCVLRTPKILHKCLRELEDPMLMKKNGAGWTGQTGCIM